MVNLPKTVRQSENNHLDERFNQLGGLMQDKKIPNSKSASLLADQSKK